MKNFNNEPELSKYSGEAQKEYRSRWDSRLSAIAILIAIASLIVAIIALFK